MKRQNLIHILIKSARGVKRAQEIAKPITVCQAIPYIKIRLRLTGQIRTGVHKKISH
jgi:hypothetical protein